MRRYLVFARARHDEPLALHGTLPAPDPQAAREAALRRLGREWVELTLVPESAVHWVVRRSGALAESGGE